MNKELFEVNRKLDLLLDALDVDPDLVYPKGYFAVWSGDIQMYHGNYLSCLDYVSRCQSGFRSPLVIEQCDND